MENWLKREAVGWHVIFYVLGCTVINLLIAALTMGIVYLFKVDFPAKESIGLEILSPTFPFLLFILAFIEEVMFRLPLAIAITYEWSVRWLFIFMVVLSVLFGISHGSVYNIPVQGAIGLMFSILFLKCGGMEERYKKAILATTTAHFLYNGALVIIMVIMDGATKL